MNHLVIAVVAAVALITTNGALAQRQVIVNGELLDGMQISQLEQLACTGIPDGNYWIDRGTGAWGYVGSPQRRGYVGDACQQRRKSLSERRLLYRPGEILSE